MEGEFLQLCKDGELEKVLLLLKEKRIDVNVTDGDGMSGLMHAAFNGHMTMCSFLLEQGADIDKETSKDWFTALMLATIAGQGAVVDLLLRAGANPEKRNKLGKNSANFLQATAFPNSKECLRIINNFLPLADMMYHTVPHSTDETDFLAPELAPHLHYLCCMNNLNPVKMLLYVKENPAVMDTANQTQVRRVFERLIEKQYKQVVNEVIAFKIHYITCLLEEVYKRTDGIDGSIKHLLVGRKVDGFPINVEQLVRKAIRTARLSALVSQLMRTLAPITPGAGKPALYYVMTTLNGRHVDVDEFACRTCGEMGAEKRCSACKQVFYCNATCQKMHWFTHKKVCEGLSKRKPKCQPVDDDMMQMGPGPPQMGPSPPQMGFTPPQMCFTPPQMGLTPPQMGLTPPQIGPSPPRTGPSPPHMGPSPPHMGPNHLPMGPKLPQMSPLQPPNMGLAISQFQQTPLQPPVLPAPLPPGFIKTEPGVINIKQEQHDSIILKVKEEVLDSNIADS